MSESFRAGWRRLPRVLRRAIVLTAGVLLLAVGAVMLVLPGPGIPLVVAALAVLAVEFVWAEALLLRVREQGARLHPRLILAHRHGLLMVVTFLVLAVLAGVGSLWLFLQL